MTGDWPPRVTRRPLKIGAYCTRSARFAVWRATGVIPITSPPAHTGTFQPTWLEGFDLLYFRLHGNEQGTVWFGDMGVPAITAAQILQADLEGTVVVVGNCFGDKGPVTKALFTAGAKTVIAGPGKNIAARERVVGVDLLVRNLIRSFRRHKTVDQAIRDSKRRLCFTSWRYSDRDAAQFNVLGGAK